MWEEKMSVQMLIRVDSKLKTKITKLARYEGKSTNQMVKEIIEDYVKERDIESYVDDLWERIGKKLKSKGITRKSIAQEIRKIRRTKR